ncbi:MAG: FecR domain-containing protein [Candidatus Omnitrophota bacterium]
MNAQRVKVQSQAGLWIWGFVILALALITYLYFFMMRPLPPDVFEVTQFVGSPEIYSDEEKAWKPLNRGDLFKINDSIRTDAGEEVDFRVQGKINVRVKEDTVLENKPPKAITTKTNYRLHLMKGALLGSTGKGYSAQDLLEITTPISVASVRGSLFRVEYNPDQERAWLGLLQGHMTIGQKGFAQRKFKLKNLQSIELVKGKATQTPIKISREDWDLMKEAYELIEKTAASEARQLDLSKEGGVLFSEYVFDHGTFYVPKFGFMEREFIRDPMTGRVFLNLSYDVFPRGSFVGMYIKTRNFDLSKYGVLKFRTRRIPGEDFPAAFRVELKSKGQVIRAFAAKMIRHEWTDHAFKFHLKKETLIDEVAFVFTHVQVGEFKKGALQMADVDLSLPEPEAVAEAVVSEETVPATVPVPS